MTTLSQLAAGLDSLDDFVRSRLRQAVAELKTRQDQIDQALDRPTGLDEPATVVTATRPVPDGFAPLNDEENESALAAIDVGAGEDRPRSIDLRDDEDEGPPQTWLV